MKADVKGEMVKIISCILISLSRLGTRRASAERRISTLMTLKSAKHSSLQDQIINAKMIFVIPIEIRSTF